MEILFKKDNHINKNAVWVCTNCGSTIKSSINEGRYVTSYNHGESDYMSVDCPNCNCVNYISLSSYKTPDQIDTSNYYQN